MTITDLTLANAPPPRQPKRPGFGPGLKLYPLMVRAMRTAAKRGRVYRAGGFNDANQDVMLKDNDGSSNGLDAGFDRPLAVDQCIAAGWLRPGEYHNTYVPTEAGRQALVDIEAARIAKIEARGEKIAAKVRERAEKAAARKAESQARKLAKRRERRSR